MAAKELQEECEIEIEEKDLIDLTDFAYGNKERGVFMSPGLLDEFMRMYAYSSSISLAKLKQFEGKLTGNIEEGFYFFSFIIFFRFLFC